MHFIMKYFKNKKQLESGPMPNMIAAQSNIVVALCQSSVIPFLTLHRKVWLRSPVREITNYRMPCCHHPRAIT